MPHRPYQTSRLSSQTYSPRFRAFTLVEMLISVTLVLLMMVLFAEIFGLASESMTLQRALADNDQQVRSFSTIIREDLKKRTFRDVIAYDPREDDNFEAIPFSGRDGYFYISLNDPDDATDNVLQFTVRSSIDIQSGDDTEFYGRATGLVQQGIAASQAQTHVRQNSRQPEHDDGELQINFTGTSSAAEITYFMRGSRLYRRVSLLRDPVAGQSGVQPRMSWDTGGSQRLTTPVEYLRHRVGATSPVVQTVSGAYRKVAGSSGGAVNSDNYWEDFDFSAVQSPFVEFGPFPPTDGAQLLGAEHLRNNTTDSVSLGNPRLRFGFDQFTGISREFSHADPAASDFFFIGRYTLEEMSHGDFNFPQNPSALGASPLSYSAVPSLVDGGVEPDGIVDAFIGGSRRGEDLLLSNVHGFEIEVWDDRIGEFLPIGHTRVLPGPNGTINSTGTTIAGDDIGGDYHRSRNQQAVAGLPAVPGDSSQWNTNAPNWIGRVFDTWHPFYDHDNADADNDHATGGDPAPYRALTFYPPAAPFGPYLNRGHWRPSRPTIPAIPGGPGMPATPAQPGIPNVYNVGDMVFPAINGEAPQDFSFYYVCIQAGTAAETEDRNNNGVLDPGEDDPANGVLGELDTGEPKWPMEDGATFEPPRVTAPTPARPKWLAVRNYRPLRAFRLRVRFLHASSGEMRQLSLIHSLVD